MRSRLLFTIFLFLLVAENGFSQNIRHVGGSRAFVSVAPDTVNLNMQVPMADLKDSIATDYGLYYGMPVVNPGHVDAKIKYWWPETDYHYNMPNAYPGNQKYFRFNGPEQNK